MGKGRSASIPNTFSMIFRTGFAPMARFATPGTKVPGLPRSSVSAMYRSLDLLPEASREPLARLIIWVILTPAGQAISHCLHPVQALSHGSPKTASSRRQRSLSGPSFLGPGNAGATFETGQCSVHSEHLRQASRFQSSCSTMGGKANCVMLRSPRCQQAGPVTGGNRDTVPALFQVRVVVGEDTPGQEAQQGLVGLSGSGHAGSTPTARKLHIVP